MKDRENKVTYISIGKPLIIQKFELYKAPMGWYRIDILKRKLKEDKDFNLKFTQTEIKQIENLK